MKWMLTRHRRKLCLCFFIVVILAAILIGRLVYLMIGRGDYYSRLAKELQQRERRIPAPRGEIVDATGEVLAVNQSVCTISVIHNQIQDPEAVIAMLVKELDLPEERVRKRVEKYSSIEKIKSNVDETIGQKILAYHYPGVKVDSDFRRYYPYGELASKVLGFTGGDHQGIIGLEAVYDQVLKGEDGRILTTTDARGVEVSRIAEERIEPRKGRTLHVSLDHNIQLYAQQAAEKTYIRKSADSVSILVMNPQSGEIMGMVDYPEFDLNHPFELNAQYQRIAETSQSKKETKKEIVSEQELLNQMWRNHCVCDTYEPGSVFKIITASAALEEQVVSLDDRFYCPGYAVVEDRRIRCHKTTGHGSQSFPEILQNSCNPSFIALGLRLGSERFYHYFARFGLLDKTHIDLPGEAGTIMHDKDAIGQVELATISFGQSFQISPIQVATTVSSLINGGNRVTPHLGVWVETGEGKKLELTYDVKRDICSTETSQKLRPLLEKVVSEGGGNKAYIEGYEIGGKTATSQTLPRSAHKYISSFLGFAPADDPRVLVLVIIRNPSGVYYGGTIAAPVAKEIFENILPYLELRDGISYTKG